MLKGTMKAGRKMTRRAKKSVVKITKTIPVRPMKSTTKAQVLTEVRRMIARQSENKMIGWNVEANVQHNSAIGAADCEPLVQQISAGTSAQQRIGDRVKPKSLKVHGVVSFNADDCTTSQNIYCRVVILAQKNIKVGSDVLGGSVDTARLLRPALAGGDQTAFSGTTMDLNYPINKDLFHVYMDKVVRFKQTKSLTQDAWVDNSHRWSYTFKSLPSSFTFDEGNGNWPNNFAPFIAVGYAYSDGTAPDTTSTRLKTNIYSALTFEDA